MLFTVPVLICSQTIVTLGVTFSTHRCYTYILVLSLVKFKDNSTDSNSVRTGKRSADDEERLRQLLGPLSNGD